MSTFSHQGERGREREREIAERKKKSQFFCQSSDAGVKIFLQHPSKQFDPDPKFSENREFFLRWSREKNLQDGNRPSQKKFRLRNESLSGKTSTKSNHNKKLSS